MPKFPGSARFLLLAAFIAASCSTYSFCQASRFEYVPNLPYTAQVLTTDVQTRANGQRVQFKTKLIESRDSQGRTCIESFDSSDTSRPALVNLYVPLQRKFIQLFPSQNKARVMTFPGAGPIPIHGPLGTVKTRVEKLPGKTIHGIYAEGSRTTRVIPADHGRRPGIVDVEESWVSPTLNVVVLSKHTSTDPGSDQTRTEILRLDRGELNAKLFEIPAGYEVERVIAGAQ